MNVTLKLLTVKLNWYARVQIQLWSNFIWSVRNSFLFIVNYLATFCEIFIQLNLGIRYKYSVTIPITITNDQFFFVMPWLNMIHQWLEFYYRMRKIWVALFIAIAVVNAGKMNHVLSIWENSIKRKVKLLQLWKYPFEKTFVRRSGHWNNKRRQASNA